jgi:hypothetical protein
MSTPGESATRLILAEAIHSLCPHANLHAFDGCPQRKHDEQEAEDLEAALLRRGISLVVITEKAA